MGTRHPIAMVNKPKFLVDREEEVEKIKRAIFNEGDECRVVLIEGAGGLGKTRLVAEVLKKLAEEWSERPDAPLTAKLIDFTDIKLHIREYFLAHLATSQAWADERIRFSLYDKEHKKYQRLLDQGVDFAKLKDVAADTEVAFWRDYARLSQNRRVVIPLDTAEQLAIISLSLYADILINGRLIPEPLQDSSLADAQQRTGSDGTEETDELLNARLKIESEFIQILFGAGDELQTRLLRSLSRCTNGLTATELHFVLDSDPDTTAAEWQKDDERLEQIKKELDNLETLSFVKPKPRDRVGLQDEMYRIYAEAMAVDLITKEKESIARKRTYRRLLDLATHRREQLLKTDEKFTRDSIARILVERPSAVLNTHMLASTEADEKKRLQLAEEIVEAELEYLHYSLLVDPNNFNSSCYLKGHGRCLSPR